MIKIKLDTVLNDFYDASSTLSTINRQIAFAGIGIVWIFVKLDNGQLFIEQSLQRIIMMFVIGLGLDMLQYVYKTGMLYIFHRCYEKKSNNENAKIEEAEFKNYLNYPTWLFFIFKVICVIIGYIHLLFYINSCMG